MGLMGGSEDRRGGGRCEGGREKEVGNSRKRVSWRD